MQIYITDNTQSESEVSRWILQELENFIKCKNAKIKEILRLTPNGQICFKTTSFPGEKINRRCYSTRKLKRSELMIRED